MNISHTYASTITTLWIIYTISLYKHVHGKKKLKKSILVTVQCLNIMNLTSKTKVEPIVLKKNVDILIDNVIPVRT